MDLQQWALPRLARLLPLDQESLEQLLAYTLSLPKQEASDHLKNFLGDSPQAFEFIAAFNQRRPNVSQAPASDTATVTQASSHNAATPSRNTALAGARGGQQRKKKPGFNKLPPPRQVEDHRAGQQGYRKPDEEDYMSGGKGRRSQQPPLANALALTTEPEATMEPKRALPLLTDPPEQSNFIAATSSAPQPQPKLPPSAAGALISDSLAGKSKHSRNSSPASKQSATTKVSLTGGASMRGATTTLNDLDSAIRTLEAQTNPSLAGSTASHKARACPCQAQRHALLAAAPNCLNCGKIICAREGLGPCTFCNAPLLSHAEIGEMLRALKEERGQERMKEHNSQHRKADVSKTPRPFASGTSTPGTMSGPGTPRSYSPLPSSKVGVDGDEDTTLNNAKAHRDRLLAFQAQNARRTRILDEAADYETPDSGTSMWASPQERALQLKRQQKVLREQEWNARPEYEKRRMVVSLDIKGGKAVRRMQELGRDEGTAGCSEDEEDPVGNDHDDDDALGQSGRTHGGSTGFAKNPLLGSLIRPVWRAPTDEASGKDKVVDGGAARGKRSTWRKVQDDDDDNERWILDGGAYGHGETKDMQLGTEEHAFG